MGIYDRDYYRGEGPSFLGSLAGQGRICYWLIGINVICFLLQVATRTRGGDGPFTDWLILVPDLVLQGQVWRLLTYAFLHTTFPIWHLLFNMLMLFWFGRQVEAVLGSREFLLFYLVSAVLGGVAYVLCSVIGIHDAREVLGASGAVTAALVLAACYNPRQVIYLFFILPVPIWGFVILAVAIDAFNLFGGHNTGVAASVHLAGAAFGFLYHKMGWRLSGLLGRLPRRSQPRLRLYREDDDLLPWEKKPAPPTGGGMRLSDEHLEAQVDAILAKIGEVGMEGLTAHERDVLLRASEEIKRRRG